ncbi:hypothetical protein [Cytobacillus depressus]|nr:hypothetical protein [Cytobacillus depressus]
MGWKHALASDGNFTGIKSTRQGNDLPCSFTCPIKLIGGAKEK